MRIDRKEHINKVDDEIVAETKRARFVFADFTIVRKSVAKSEVTLSIPTLAKIAVSAAKDADRSAQNCQAPRILMSPRTV